MGVKKSCDMDCLHCEFDKCLDEMARSEKRKAMGQILLPGKTEAEGVSEEEKTKEERRKEKRKKQQADWYQRNKERLAAEAKAERQRKKEQKMKKEVAAAVEKQEEQKNPAGAPEKMTAVVAVKTEDVVEKEKLEKILHLTGDQAYNLKLFIEAHLLADIRPDSGVDWLADMCEIWRALG